MEEVIKIIQTLGFPMALCIFCIYYITTLNREYREETQKREENYFSQLNSISKSLAEISKTMEMFNKRLEIMEEKLNE